MSATMPTPIQRHTFLKILPLPTRDSLASPDMPRDRAASVTPYTPPSTAHRFPSSVRRGWGRVRIDHRRSNGRRSKNPALIRTHRVRDPGRQAAGSAGMEPIPRSRGN